jgi:hypothetical protein
MTSRAAIAKRAAEILGHDTESLLHRIAGCQGGQRYLLEKIINEHDWQIRHDHTRPLKYANHFLDNSAEVEFVREREERTPDLRIGVLDLTFNLEVKKFRMTEEEGTKYPVEKFLGSITKTGQLPQGEIGLIAVDNFDIRLEPHLGYQNIEDALHELDRQTVSGSQSRLSGVIVSACSAMGHSEPVELPYFVWFNRYAECPLPQALVTWLLSALPASRVLASKVALN